MDTRKHEIEIKSKGRAIKILTEPTWQQWKHAHEGGQNLGYAAGFIKSYQLPFRFPPDKWENKCCSANIPAVLTLNEWQAGGGHHEWRNLTFQICPELHKQQITIQMNKLNESINFVQILVRPRIYDVPHIAEGDPAFLGVCWRAAATIAIQTDSNTAPGWFSRSGAAVEQVHRFLLKWPA